MTEQLQAIEKQITLIRGQKVLIDSSLAILYGVETKALIQAIKRNSDRFPEDFMFQLTNKEHEILRSQTVTSKGRGGRRYPPYAFTEQGVAMLSSVLRSKQAIAVNVEIMRAFVRLRQMLAENTELKKQLDKLEEKYDQQFRVVFDVIRNLMSPEKTHSRSIGFIWDDKD